MFRKVWKRPETEEKRGSRYRLTAAIAAVSILTLAVSGIVRFCVNYISTNVRSTTIQTISELTGSKAATLAAILDETARDMYNVTYALSAAKDRRSASLILEAFQESHELKALVAFDKERNVLYGDMESLVMKGIPDDFSSQVESDGFAMSDTLFGVDGDREILLGAAIPGGGVVYAALSTDSLQKTCGEDTYLGEGYSYVVERNGNIIIPPFRYSYEQIYENIRVLLSDSKNTEEELEPFMKALSDGRSGSVVFMINGQEQILCFTPVETEKEWQFVTVVPLKVVEKEGTRIMQTTVCMAAMIIAVIIIALSTAVLFYLSAQRRQRKNDRFLLDIYQAISRNTDTVIFILNKRTGRLDYVFENSERLLGISFDEFLKGEEQETGTGAFFKELQALLLETCPVEGCQRKIHIYNDRLHRDMWLKILTCPFYLGNDPKCIYAVTDITKEQNDRETIAAAVVAAEQANAAKSSFFSNMSHDMRTPMNGIIGMTAIAKRNIENKDRVMDCLNKIDFSSKHLLDLINDVLDMSKIESGKLALASESFSLPEIFNDLEAILKSQCDDRKQKLSFDLHIKQERIRGDALRLKQIFMNLLSNAVKFTPIGGTIVLTAEEREPSKPGYAAWRFTVADNGIGMSSDFQKVIFTPFERVGDTYVYQTEGTGLGLAITKNLISAMGGQISLKSEIGHGTTFFVDLELPLQEKEPAVCKPTRNPEMNEAFFAGKRFLLAEDNAINQEVAVELLCGYGAKVDVAANGDQALTYFKGSTPGYYDAILMDIQMPVMNGYDAARAIRSCGHIQAETIPIIAMTANVFTEDVLAARNAGMDAHIPKPLDFEQLYYALENRAADDRSGKDSDDKSAFR
ncbi:ATP-binding protein [Clostridium sp. AM58-1XD]|uniref:ATP-binding protein n=1 Tax=Clostridium sp. AM58-1XD TaxID=2292307 RepID=UPI0015F4E779|nr:ATP-binding protein [Clostridium sp. AM58-1XD]